MAYPANITPPSELAVNDVSQMSVGHMMAMLFRMRAQ